MRAMEYSTTEPGFWWNWWVQVAVAVGKMVPLLYALFGDWLRAPKLRLSFANASGAAKFSAALPPGSAVARAGGPLRTHDISERVMSGQRAKYRFQRTRSAASSIVGSRQVRVRRPAA